MAATLDMLALEYQAEESQTMTTAFFNNNQSNQSDGSGNEYTVIEDTMIGHNDAYIDRLIMSRTNIDQPRYSESTTIANNPNNRSTFSPKPLHSELAHLAQETSVDSLLAFEHLENQITEQKKEMEQISQQLKEQSKENDDLLKANDDLKHQIKKLNDNKQQTQNNAQIEKQTDELNEKISDQKTMIQSLCKQIEQYENINEWLQAQIKWDKNVSVNNGNNNKKITVHVLQKWKNSLDNNMKNMKVNDNNDYDDIEGQIKMNELTELLAKERVKTQEFSQQIQKFQMEQFNLSRYIAQQQQQMQLLQQLNEQNVADEEKEKQNGTYKGNKKGKNKNKNKNMKGKKKKKYKRGTATDLVNGEAEHGANNAEEACCVYSLWNKYNVL